MFHKDRAYMWKDVVRRNHQRAVRRSILGPEQDEQQADGTRRARRSVRSMDIINVCSAEDLQDLKCVTSLYMKRRIQKDHGEFFLLDLRSSGEFLMEHLPGAVNILDSEDMHDFYCWVKAKVENGAVTMPNTVIFCSDDVTERSVPMATYLRAMDLVFHGFRRSQLIFPHVHFMKDTYTEFRHKYPSFFETTL